MNRFFRVSQFLLLVSFATPSAAWAETAQLATSWSGVKYAFCEVQGQAILIDFMGGDFTTGDLGSAHVGFRACSSARDFAWQTTDGVTIDWSQFGDFEVDLGNLGYIQGGSLWDWKNQDGFAMINAKTGQCFFLSNDGTQGLPFKAAACD